MIYHGTWFGGLSTWIPHKEVGHPNSSPNFASARLMNPVTFSGDLLLIPGISQIKSSHLLRKDKKPWIFGGHNYGPMAFH